MNQWKNAINSDKALNVCHRLYTLGKRRKELKEFHVRQKQEEEILVERSLYTFKPNLELTDNRNTNILKEKCHQQYDRLMEWKKLKDNKINNQIKEKTLE